MFCISKQSRTGTGNAITEGPIWKALLSFFFPILLGTFFQQLYNTVDAVVVGRFVGKQALAAVGGGSSVFVNLIVGFFMGLSSGAGVLISQFYGAGRGTELSRAVHTAIAMSIAGGLIMTAMGIGLCGPVLTATGTPQDTMEPSLVYLRIFFAGMVPMSLYNMGSGILRAVGDSRTPLIILIAGCAANIALDMLLVLGLRLGVAGVALATIICQAGCAAATLAVLGRSRESWRFTWKKLAVSPHILREILRIGFPAGIQSSLYTISNIIIQSFVNAFGTDTVAAWAAFGKIDSIFWMTVSALGIAVTTFSGQNCGAHQYRRVRQGMQESMLLATVLTLLMSAVFLTAGQPLFLLFSSDGAVIEKGMHMLRFLVPFWLTYISIEILSGTIRGAGASFVPMLMTVFGVCLLRIVWLFAAVPRSGTLDSVMASYPITWTVTSIMFWVYYLCGRWIPKSEPPEI